MLKLYQRHWEMLFFKSEFEVLFEFQREWIHAPYVGGHENPLGIDWFDLDAVMNRVFRHGLQYSYFGGKDRLFGGRQYNAPQTYSLRMNRVTKSPDMNKGSFFGSSFRFQRCRFNSCSWQFSSIILLTKKSFLIWTKRHQSYNIFQWRCE